jgi:hypothetical protein
MPLPTEGSSVHQKKKYEVVLGADESRSIASGR